MVITDVILLGEMTGLELTERIAYEYPNVKVILMRASFKHRIASCHQPEAALED